MAAVSTRDQRGPDRGEKNVDAASRALGLSTGWNVFSYLIAGMVAYGGIGWLIGRAVHISLLFPIGMIVGLGISVGYVIYRDRKSTRLNSSHIQKSRMPSSA